MMLKLVKNSSGVVLILVIAVVALFTVMVVEFSTDQGIDIELAYNFRDSLQAQYVSRAGVEAALVLLAQDDPAYDAYDEDWANFSEYAMTASAFLEGPSFTGTLVDECSKFDLNSLVSEDGKADDFRRSQFMRLFGQLEIDISADDLNDLLDALIDWIDPDDETDFGAETEYYEALENPYVCKNGPLDVTEEILLVKGMAPEYFFGTEEYEGVANYITAGTNGKININTASEQVLFSIIPEGLNEEDVVQTILDSRPVTPENVNALIDNIGFRVLESENISDLEKELLWLQNNVITLMSTRFRVDIKGVMPSGAMVNLRAVVERINNGPRIVYYKLY
ncbi:MAG: type II secretion system minor pseudopilin GspK [Deltaproteobacteria bacterium]|nr:type II secretion system minor pseudopilin GspK [Deltaproteobacteria bacterium]